jgi:hypothetical protein
VKVFEKRHTASMRQVDPQIPKSEVVREKSTEAASARAHFLTDTVET